MGRPFSAVTFPEKNFACCRIENEFARKIRHEMFGHADRSNTRAAATVRDAKCFVQIQMANVRAVITGATKTDLRIHVRAVHVNLSAVRVHDVADFADRWLDNAVRRWLGDHQRGEVACVSVCFGAQIGEIDIAIF